MFNLKMKKISIIAGAAASVIMLSTFSGFATGLSKWSFGKQTGAPNEIILSEPGDYRLIGAGMESIFNNQEPNTIIVNTQDKIKIDGNGKYNITLDNININIGVKAKDEHNISSAISINGNADVNLVFVGRNFLTERTEFGVGLYSDFNSKLTITGLGENSFLDVHGEYSGIQGTNITIKGGEIKATGNKSIGIGTFGRLFRSSKDFTVSLIIYDGVIEASGHELGIGSENIIVNGGIIRATSNNGMSISGDLTTNRGEITATNIEGDDITINGGGIAATKITGNRDIIIDGGNVTLTGDVGLNGDKVKISGGYITITGISSGKITMTGTDKNDWDSIIDAKDVIVENDGKIVWEMNPTIFLEATGRFIKSGNDRIAVVSEDGHVFEALKPIKLVDKNGKIIACMGNGYNFTGGTINGTVINNSDMMKNSFKGATKNARDYFSDCEFIFQN